MKFHEKRVVITGGVGTIGQSLVKLFVRQGAQVFFTDRSEEDCADFCAAMKKKGLETNFLSGDLRRKTHCETIVGTAVKNMGGIDILINNAGTIPRGNILETTDDMWFSALDVNLNAAFFLSRATIPYMEKAGGGAIVNASSVWGIDPGRDHIAYCSSKGALTAFTKSLGRDHAADNIRVNAVCPNEVDKPMLPAGFTGRSTDLRNRSEYPANTAPLEQAANPKEIAEVIAFLVSDESRHICGETIEVTGAKAS